MAGTTKAGGPSVGAFLAAAGLAGTAGWVDAVAYMGLHAFVANMTGAVVILGLSAAELDITGIARQAPADFHWPARRPPGPGSH